MPKSRKPAKTKTKPARAKKPSNKLVFRAYELFIDNKPYESRERMITGAQLREMAQIEPEYRIFFEKHREHNEANGHTPDREIGDKSAVDLAEPGDEKFYTLHVPSMDIA